MIGTTLGRNLGIYAHFKLGGVWVHLLAGQGVRDRVIFVVRECVWNALVVLLGLPTFGDTGSLGYLPRCVVYHLSGSTLVATSAPPFPFGE